MHEHKGAAFVEMFQNCNVFNDGAFDAILKRDARPNMLIDLAQGEPIRFGSRAAARRRGQRVRRARVVDVAEVGVEGLLVHDEHRDDPTLAFASVTSRRTRPPRPHRSESFAMSSVPIYEVEVQAQLAAESGKKGPGDLAKVIASGATWAVGNNN